MITQSNGGIYGLETMLVWKNTNEVIRQILSPPVWQSKMHRSWAEGPSQWVTENTRNVQFLRQQYDFRPGVHLRKVLKIFEPQSLS